MYIQNYSIVNGVDGHCKAPVKILLDQPSDYPTTSGLHKERSLPLDGIVLDLLHSEVHNVYSAALVVHRRRCLTEGVQGTAIGLVVPGLNHAVRPIVHHLPTGGCPLTDFLIDHLGKLHHSLRKLSGLVV